MTLFHIPESFILPFPLRSLFSVISLNTAMNNSQLCQNTFMTNVSILRHAWNNFCSTLESEECKMKVCL